MMVASYPRSVTSSAARHSGRKKEDYVCRACEVTRAQRHSSYMGLCARCHEYVIVKRLCLRCCKTPSRRPREHYHGLCVRCYKRMDTTIECRRCQKHERRFDVTKVPFWRYVETHSLCVDCYDHVKASHLCAFILLLIHVIAGAGRR